MKSGLQSNEVRIPKADGGASPKHAPNLSRATKAKSEERGATAPKPPDFDLGSPCQYFKSSFARSLSMHSHQAKSLDFGVNFGLSRSATIREVPSTDKEAAAYSDGEYFDIDCPPPLPFSEPPSLPAVIRGNGQPATAGNGAVPRNKNNARPNVAVSKLKNTSKRRSYDSTDGEVLRLRKECQNLVEENRRLAGFNPGPVDENSLTPGNNGSLESVILQTQIDTLQWQLKQVEASREMYRAVMEEVVRFLERCHRSLDSIQNEQISRPKSVHYLCRNDSSCEPTNPTNARARSSTNLMDETLKFNSAMIEEDTFMLSLPATAASNSYKDYTWKRAQKRQTLSTADFNPGKLAQEAFRLFRTAQNLLNTQEPDLAQAQLAGVSPYATANMTPTLLPNSIQQRPTFNAPSKPESCQSESDSFCLTFSRKLNMRESRSSLRSSTDGSVHSTSSSKTETDEEICPARIKESTISSTEDESGFSSISSFQEIGLPLHSTLIGRNDSSESNIEMGMESRNSTLKASQSKMLYAQSPSHRRWDSAPIVPPRPSLNLFPGEETSSSVLWV